MSAEGPDAAPQVPEAERPVPPVGSDDPDSVFFESLDDLKEWENAARRLDSQCRPYLAQLLTGTDWIIEREFAFDADTLYYVACRLSNLGATPRSLPIDYRHPGNAFRQCKKYAEILKEIPGNVRVASSRIAVALSPDEDESGIATQPSSEYNAGVKSRLYLESQEPSTLTSQTAELITIPVEELIGQIHDVQSQLGLLEVTLDELVAQARQGGASWATIGRAVGITERSAHQRWSETGRERHRAAQQRYAASKIVAKVAEE